MTLVGAAVTPHPPIIVPEVGGDRLPDVGGTVEAMRRLSGWVAELKPESIVLLSPHAPLSTQRMSVSLARRYEGSLSQFGVSGVSLHFEGNVALGEGILRQSLDREIHVQPMVPADDTAELDHGAVVPLYYLTEGLEERPQLVLLNFSLQGVAAHLSFGEAVGAAADMHPERVLFVASGDLSHRLTPDAPAGYSPQGAEFDQQVVEVLRKGSGDDLVAIPEALVNAAGECGYRSLLVLFGALSGREYATDVLSYEGPFGVGYLVGRVRLAHGAAGSWGSEA